MGPVAQGHCGEAHQTTDLYGKKTMLCCVLKIKQTEMLVCKYEVDWLSQLSYQMQAGSDPDRAKNWSLCCHVQFGSGAHPPSCSMGTGFFRGKTAGA